MTKVVRRNRKLWQFR